MTERQASQGPETVGQNAMMPIVVSAVTLVTGMGNSRRWIARLQPALPGLVQGIVQAPEHGLIVDAWKGILTHSTRGA